MGNGEKIDCANKCKKCQVKFWLWKYKAHSEYMVRGQIKKEIEQDDYHVVSGKVSCDDGSDQKNVYSKNGSRALKGPDFGSKFKPKEREQLRENNIEEKLLYYDKAKNDGVTYKTPAPVMFVRNNMKESCHCLNIENIPGR